VVTVKNYIYLSLITITALALLLFGTNPRNISSAALIAPFVLIFIVLFLTASYFLRLKGLTKRASWIIATFIALLPTLLLVLQSIGQLTIRDVATIIALFAIAYFYAIRVDSSVSGQ
jgi:NADH:ubiquinone oxidoreductase subunit 3 (subunit A)